MTYSYIFTRAGAPAIYGQGLEAQLGGIGIDELRGLGSYEMLGAFTRKGFTVDYYAPASSLSFDNKGIKSLYEGLRNFDIDFQKTISDVVKSIGPLLPVIETVSLGALKAKDIKKMRPAFPSAGVAVLLEVAAGKRPFDQGFKAGLQILAQNLDASAAELGIIAAVSGVLAGSAAAAVAASVGVGAPLASVTAALAPVAIVCAPAAIACGVVSAILKSIAGGKIPSKKDFKKSVQDTARLTGQKVPSDAEIDVMYAGLSAAQTAGGKKAEPVKQLTDTKKFVQFERPVIGRPAPKVVSRTLLVAGGLGVGAVLLYALSRGR